MLVKLIRKILFFLGATCGSILFWYLEITLSLSIATGTDFIGNAVLLNPIYVAIYMLEPYFPSQEEKGFIKTCKDLNGKEFNLENIKSLNGFCGSKYCTQSDINTYNGFSKMCGQFMTDEAYANINKIDPTNGSVVDPATKALEDCINSFNNKNGNWFGVGFYLSINQGDWMASHWKCNIREVNSSIKADTEFWYD